MDLTPPSMRRGGTGYASMTPAVSTPKKQTARLSETMIGVLRMASLGQSLYTYCSNRSEHGARTGSITALQRRGLLVGDAITEQGQAALLAAQQQGRARG